MSENARYNWTHGIKKNLSDQVNGKTLKRDIRYSLTFRKLTNKMPFQ